ncbi:MAG: hypothetical protein Q9227_006146 [Pyrenula ochraceoflavens]
MADVAGLVIGAIALASLFSTCLELLDVFELGRNYGYDYQLACTKLALLKSRLSCWGRALNVQAPGYESPALRDRWPAERDTIGRSLFGIQTLLSDSSVLIDKYKLTPKRSRTLKPFKAHAKEITYQVADSDSVPPTSTRALFRKRTLWAIRDKSKFESLIQDLSFLIENLEKVTDRLRRPLEVSETPYSNQLALQGSKIMSRNNALGNIQTPPPSVPSSPVQERPPQTSRDATQSSPQRLPTSTSVLNTISGDQTNNGGAVGLQGVLGDMKERWHITGTQTNLKSSFGVQGGASAEAMAILLGRVAANADVASDRTSDRRGDTN